MVANCDPKVSYAINRIDTILSTNVFFEPRHPLRESAFIELLIRLHDLTFEANRIGKRISFTDDINIFPSVKDVTDAIRECRDAVCHMRANSTYLTRDGHPAPRGSKAGLSELTFCVINGQGNFIYTPRYVRISLYDDDMCFFYGAHQLYLKRHLIRALDEAKAIFVPPAPARPF